MLGAIREFALEQLQIKSEAEDAAMRHADYFVGLAERGEPELHDRNQLEWLERLEADHDNMRAALRWCVDRSDAERTLRMSGALGWFWSVRGYFSEGRTWLEEALALPFTDELKPARAKALLLAGVLAYRQSNPTLARSLLEEGITLWDRTW